MARSRLKRVLVVLLRVVMRLGLVQIMMPEAERRNHTRMYNKWTLRQVMDIVTEVRPCRLIRLGVVECAVS